MTEQPSPRVCDYEDSTYRTDFWEEQGREYEDRVERIAIRRLMPPSGERLIEIGAGYGRLVPLYSGYRQVVLFDYSRSHLAYARQGFGDDGFLYVVGNVYRMPFAPGVFDAALMIRVLHHIQEPPLALEQIRQILGREGVFLLEFANKRNLKAIGRWLLRRQRWNPFTHRPVEFAELHYDFHPQYVRDTLAGAGFKPTRALTVSHFRLGLLKRTIPVGVLAALDSLAQFTGQWWQLTPSVFVQSRATGGDMAPSPDAFWRCPACDSLEMHEKDDGLICRGCHRYWKKVDGIYDFKEA